VSEAAALGQQTDGYKTLWEAETGQSLGFQKRPSTGILEIASSPDGRTLLMSPMGLRSSAWTMDAETGKPIGKSMVHTGVVTGGYFNPNSEAILTIGGRSGSWAEARLWKVATGEPIGQPLQHSGRILTAAFSADGKMVLTGSEDGTAQLWSADTGHPLGPPLQHSGPVHSVAFSPDKKTIATGCADQTARLWHLPSRKPLGPPLSLPASVSLVVFGQEGRTLTTMSSDGTVRVWEVPASMKGNIDHIRLWVQVSTGMELNGEAARLLDDTELEARWKRLQEVGAVPR
jgi:WD40 repeat protein